MELKEKAWVANPEQFDKPWFAPDDIYYGDTLGKAKSVAWKAIESDSLKTRWGDDITFLNLKLIRCKHADKYLVDGELKTMGRIEEENQYKERARTLEALVAANPNAKAYIRKGGYYYRPNSCGYTERELDAGVYSIQEAASAVMSCGLRDNMKAIVINPEEHNAMILSKIEELKSKLI
jgi:hypothetical protein